MELDSRSKVSKKIGAGVKLAFDLTILKPADYINAAATEATARKKKKKKEE